MINLHDFSQLSQNLTSWLLQNPSYDRDTTRLYFLLKTTDLPMVSKNLIISHFSDDKNAHPQSYNRLGGPPPRALVDPVDGWPRFIYQHDVHHPDDVDLHESDAAITDPRMEHLCTIDVRDLRLGGLPLGTHAVSLFLSSSRKNGAYEEDSGDVTLRFWSAADMKKGFLESHSDDALRRPYALPEAQSFSIGFLDVPHKILESLAEDRAEDSEMRSIYKTIAHAAGRLGGEEIWLPFTEEDEDNADDDEDSDVYEEDIEYEYTNDAHDAYDDDAAYDDDFDADQDQKIVSSSKSHPINTSVIKEVPMVGLSSKSDRFLLQLSHRFTPICGDVPVTLYVYANRAFWR